MKIKWLFFFIPLLLGQLYASKEAYSRFNYDTGRCHDISITTPYRTGSTLVYNVVRTILGNADVMKQHFPGHTPDNFTQDDSKLQYDLVNSFLIRNCPSLHICTIRNPIHACYSSIRVWYLENQITQGNGIDLDEANRVIDKYITAYINQINQMRLFLTTYKNRIILKYELFENDIGYIIDTLQKVFTFNVSQADRDYVITNFAKENINNLTNEYKDFYAFDTETRFHGNHIDEGNVPAEVKNMIMEMIRDKLKVYEKDIQWYGYEL